MSVTMLSVKHTANRTGRCHHNPHFLDKHVEALVIHKSSDEAGKDDIGN